MSGFDSHTSPQERLMMASNYQQQYCEKHKQPYAGFLKECPICVGEKMAEEDDKSESKKDATLNK